MKYIHVLHRERGSYFGSLQHMIHLAEALTAKGYMVAVIDYHHMFADGSNWTLTESNLIDKNLMFYVNREDNSVGIEQFWTDLEEWSVLYDRSVKSKEVFIFVFTTHADIHDLSMHVPKSYPLKPNLVMAKAPKYPEVFRLIQRIDSYTFSEAVIKWMPENGRTEVLSMHKDRNLLDQDIVREFELLLRQTEAEDKMGGKNGKKDKRRMGFKKTR